MKDALNRVSPYSYYYFTILSKNKEDEIHKPFLYWDLLYMHFGKQ